MPATCQTLKMGPKYTGLKVQRFQNNHLSQSPGECAGRENSYRKYIEMMELQQQKYSEIFLFQEAGKIKYGSPSFPVAGIAKHEYTAMLFLEDFCPAGE